MIDKLPPRERQIFEALYARGEATASELCANMDDPPSNSAARVMLSRLERKGFVTHRAEQGTYFYSAAVPEPAVRQTAVRQFIDTYFRGSPIGAATALIGMSREIGEEEIEQLQAAIAKAREEGGQ